MAFAHESHSHGKWLIFRNFEDLNETWCVIRDEVLSGCLGATGAKCSTLRYNPLRHGTGPKTTGRITVFTKKEDYIEVGMKLIKLDVIKHDICYKTLEVTIAGEFAHMPGMENKRITCMSIFWNGGTPYASKDPRGPKCPAPCRNKHQYDPSKDIWKLNIVQGIPECKSQPVHGKWIVVSNYDAKSEINITRLWHMLKGGVEEGEIRAIEMQCPAPRYHDDSPEIHVFTAEDNMTEVGDKIIHIVKHDIRYIVGEGNFRDDVKTRYWNRGTPSYDNSPMNWRSNLQ